MPMVGGKKFPYTEKGKADAKRAAGSPKSSAEAPKGQSYRIFSTDQMEELRSISKNQGEAAKFSPRESDALTDSAKQAAADRQRYTKKLDPQTKAKAIYDRDSTMRAKKRKQEALKQAIKRKRA